jgi:hypothetical protein
MRHALEQVVRQMHAYSLQAQTEYADLMTRLYPPGAEFHCPAAKLSGRHAVVQFWNLFLLMHVAQRSDVHHMSVDVTWDPDKRRALCRCAVVKVCMF